MAVAPFPALKPSSRMWTPGSQPVQSFTSLSGYEARVLLGPNPIGTSLSMSFRNLREAMALQITSHYSIAKGIYEVFALPAEVFAGMNDYWGVTPLGFSWRYVGPPQVEWVAPGIANVSVTLTAVLV